MLALVGEEVAVSVTDVVELSSDDAAESWSDDGSGQGSFAKTSDEEIDILRGAATIQRVRLMPIRTYYGCDHSYPLNRYDTSTEVNTESNTYA